MTENQTTNTPSKNNKKSNLTLWIMIVLFGLPYAAATYFYLNRDEIDLGSTSNYGTLINPARPISDIELQSLNNSSFKLSSLKGTWILLSIGSSSCAKECVDNLYKIRQLKKAVGQDFKRISKVFFYRILTILRVLLLY